MVILDDHSTDRETRATLAALARDHEVIQDDGRLAAEHKTGGLSGMMIQAMLIARDRGCAYALFIQDDMQFVRRLTAQDFKHWSSYFAAATNSFQISPNFIRVLGRHDMLANCPFDERVGAYVRLPEQESGKSSFSDTGVFDVARYFALFHPFEVGEIANSRKARERGLVLGRSPYPFMCWLPYPTSYRGKKKSLLHLTFEVLGRSGFYPIRFMSDAEAAAFMRRPPHDLPLMERYLDAPDNPRPERWSTGGGEYTFLAYGGFAARGFKAMRNVK
jgi:hypothetical protein